MERDVTTWEVVVGWTRGGFKIEMTWVDTFVQVLFILILVEVPKLLTGLSLYNCTKLDLN